MIRKLTLLLILYSGFSLSVFAETIILKSGKKVDAQIIERTDKNIKVNLGGVTLTYYFDEIESIDGIAQGKEEKEIQLSSTATADLSSNGIDIEHIRRLLKELRYPEHCWSDIEKELVAFLTKINFSQLKNKAQYVKNNPSQLKDLLTEIGKLIEDQRRLVYPNPHPLLLALINSLAEENVIQLIESTPLSFEEKEKQDKFQCSAISQLGSILLSLLGIEVKVGLSPNHNFNYVALNDHEIIFADMTNQIFEIINLDNYYYRNEYLYFVLKPKYKLTKNNVDKIRERLWKGDWRFDQKEILNAGYSYIFLANNYSVTPFIYTNIGSLYQSKNDIDKAITYFNQAVQINQNYAEAYYNRGNAYLDKGNSSEAIIDYNHALKINPNYAEAYNNRGNAYKDKGDYDQASADYNQALQIDPDYAQAYYNRGGIYDDKGKYNQAIADYSEALRINPNYAPIYYNRGVTYLKKGEIDQAILDFSHALQINPNLAMSYYNRSVAYFSKRDYDQAWQDLHKAENLGYQANPEFLNELRRASGREK